MAAFSARDMAREAAALPPPDAPAPDRVNPQAERLTALAEKLAGHAAKPAYSRIVFQGIVRVVEFALVASVGLALHQWYVAPAGGIAFGYLVAVPLIAAAVVAVFQIFGLHRIGALRSPVPAGLRAAAGWTLVFLAALAAVFFLKLDILYSRIWLLAWYAGGFVTLLVERTLVSYILTVLTANGRLDRRTVVVGGGTAAEQLFKELASQDQADLSICGFFDDRTGSRSPDVVAGYPKLGAVDDLVEFARHTRIDLIIFALPITAEGRLLEMLRKLWVLPIDIRLAAHTNKLRFRPRAYSYIGSVPVIDVFDKPIADWDVVAKAAFDRVVGTLALLALSPVLLAVAIAVKLDSRGPVFFRQRRYGFNNERIEIYKFRSMYVDQTDFEAAKQVTRGDPRVTRVGRFIRKTSLDELPQLLNVVLHGNLSLVGPRPHALHTKAADKQYEDVVDGYFARHRVKPGITGWAQINGWRGETDTPEKIQRRVECDLYYIENWSLFLDMYIMMATPLALLKTENAY